MSEQESHETNALVWLLLRGKQIIGELVVYGGDFPWVNGRFHPREGFEEVRPLFEEELRRLDDVDESVAEWEKTYGRVRSTVNLAAPDGHLVAEFILHIDGQEAWWTWTDEPS